MSLRAIKARVVCDQQTLEKLWRTHVVFNERLLPLIRTLFKMRRGEFGATPQLQRLYQDIGLYVTNYSSQQADYFLNAISMLDRPWTCSNPASYKDVNVRSPNGKERTIRAADWIPKAIELSKAKQVVFDKEAMHGDLPGCMRQMLGREAVMIISGHDELTQIWEQEHEAWLKEKAEWESDPENRKYLAVRPHFEKFEETVGGKIRERRGRWHKYLDFLRDNPCLAAWRGGEAVVHDLDHAARERVRKARRTRQRTVEAEEFWKINPELRALDRLHGDYERKFVRRGKRKRNADGFKHRPTFTEPHPTLHPRWFVFNGPQTNPTGWRDLQIPSCPRELGSVSLELLTGDKTGARYPTERIIVRFKADPRLCDFRHTLVRSKIMKGKNKGREVERPAFLWHDRQLNKGARPASIGGIKLMFDIRADGTPSAAFLVFACDIENLALSELARKVKAEFSDELNPKSGRKKFKGRTIPDGLVTLAVDIGIRHVGFATLARWNGGKLELLRARNVRIDSAKTGAPRLRALGDHKWELRQRRRQRGNPIKGEKSHVELQQHIDYMGEDRFKKAARAIVNLALNAAGDIDKRSGQPYPRADVLIIEDLGKLKPDATFERGVNRTITTFNHGHIADRIEELAEDVGLRVERVAAWATSQVCYRCGSLGRRYSIRRERPDENDRSSKCRPEVHFGFTDPLFACPKCFAGKRPGLPYTCNSDFNAAMNLQRRFYFDRAAIKDFGDNKDERAERLERIDAELEPRLRQLHNLDETPW